MSRSAALLTHMAAMVAMVDEAIAKAKGEKPLKPEPAAPLKPEPAAPLKNGSRSYRVSDWRATCKGCGRDGRCWEDKYECGSAKWFPIVHYVSLTIVDGVVVSSVCCEGRKAGGPPCSDAKCKHVDRAIAAMGGSVEKGVDVVMVSGAQKVMPKCPNCRERWGVTAKADGRFECRNPVCVRDNRPWVFEEGDTKRPLPMRHELVVKEREPGRVVRKAETSKRWGA